MKEKTPYKRYLLFSFLILLFSPLYLGMFNLGPITSGLIYRPFLFIIAVSAILVTFINTDWAITILIFSMLLSPELTIARVIEKAVVVRVDDILLIIIFFTWLAKTAINKELGLLKKTPINKPIIFYTLTCILLTARGIITGHVIPANSFFFLLKYIEYFMLYFLIANNLKDEKQIKKFIFLLFITCILVLGYGYSQYRSGGRLSAPFEGTQPEPNTLAGYLVLIFAIAAGIFLSSNSLFWRLFSGGLLTLIFPVFLHTFSRGGYLGFIGMYIALFILSKRRRIFLIIPLIFIIFFSQVFLPVAVIHRIVTTFLPGMEWEFFGRKIALDSSASQRIVFWQQVMKVWEKSPFFGYGVTGVGLVDSQYPRILGELGLTGLGIFIWLIFSILKQAFIALRLEKGDFLQGLILGFIAGLVGLLTHSVGANIFIIVRIMEPFWFLTAIIIMIPYLKVNE